MTTDRSYPDKDVGSQYWWKCRIWSSQWDVWGTQMPSPKRRLPHKSLRSLIEPSHRTESVPCGSYNSRVFCWDPACWKICTQIFPDKCLFWHEKSRYWHGDVRVKLFASSWVTSTQLYRSLLKNAVSLPQIIPLLLPKNYAQRLLFPPVIDSKLTRFTDH